MKKTFFILTLLFISISLFSQTVVWEKRWGNHAATPYYNYSSNSIGTNIVSREDGNSWTFRRWHSVEYGYENSGIDLSIVDNNGLTNDNGLPIFHDLQQVFDFTTTKNNGLLLVGENFLISKNANNDFYNGANLFKIDSSGNIVWNFSITESMPQSFIAEKDSSTIFICNSYYQARLFEINPAGENLSETLIDATGFVDMQIDTIADNIFIIKTDANSNISVIKLDYLYNQIAEYNYGGNGTDLPINLCLTTDGGFIFAATTTSTDGDITESFGLQDIWIVKCNSAGNIEWQKSVGTANNDNITNITSLANGNYAFGYGGSINVIDSVGNFMFEYQTDDEITYVDKTVNGNFLYSGINDGSVFAEISSLGYHVSSELTSVECGGVGFISGEAYGYFPPFTYNWSNDDTTANVSDLEVGTYFLTVTDSLNNTMIDTFEVIYSEFIGINAIISTDTSNNHRKIYFTPSAALTDSFSVYTADSSFFETNSTNTTVVIDSINTNSVDPYYFSSANICGQSTVSSLNPLTISGHIDTNGVFILNCISYGYPTENWPHQTLYFELYKRTNGVLLSMDTISYNPFEIEYPLAYVSLLEGNNEFFIKMTTLEVFSNIVSINYTSTDILEKETQITIFPNPANKKIYINSPEYSIDEINIYDISGKLVYSNTNKMNNNIQIDISNFTAGLYFVKVQNGDNVQTQKLIIQ